MVYYWERSVRVGMITQRKKKTEKKAHPVNSFWKEKYSWMKLVKSDVMELTVTSLML